MENNAWRDKHGRPEIIAGKLFRGASAPMVRFTNPEQERAAHETQNAEG
jgi:hypothetical protein